MFQLCMHHLHIPIFWLNFSKLVTFRDGDDEILDACDHPEKKPVEMLKILLVWYYKKENLIFP